ncbi:M20/M25/M40 family metallo-hydrolase [Streptococcus ictaluri]|uniref:Peptidase dimerization domain protein n=1 Tax=Streptococcus ictaluri 707-05 TaxID=764299 RepID=G5K1B1_9STRE|nr:M20/M25/M40 family metallo-hydrolase [Streptococcus ictaluri]EHI70179.1 peptidase dimerization domain protein [Streptococcus ictaluri 707-05]
MLEKENVASSHPIWHRDNTKIYLKQLEHFLAIRSIFAQKVGLKEAALFLEKLFKEAGAEVLVDSSEEAPLVIAQFKSPKKEAKTIIFYNHYDTVPADQDQEWTYPAFGLSIEDGKMYGRGVDDDKGHIIARLTAVTRYLQEVGDLPLHIIFVMEGAEESASVGLEKYLERHANLLKGADLLVWEQGIRNACGKLEFTGGNKGILTFNMSVNSASCDIHSQFGGIIESASWYLLQALTSLRDEKGKLLIPAIYERVIPPSQRELDLVEQYALENAPALKKLYGLKLPTLQSERRQLLKTYYFEPSIGIQGLWIGYQGQGVKTIIPCQAQAKMEVRLVPGLEPKWVFETIKEHLLCQGFDKVNLEYSLGESSYRSDLSANSITNLLSLASRLNPEGISLLPTSAGTGPMHMVFKALEVPIVGFGLGHSNSRDHAGDENVLISDYCRHIELIEELITSYE